MAKKDYPEGMRKAALPIFISNAVFGIGIIEYPVGTPHRKFSFFYITIILTLYILSAIYAFPYLKDIGSRIMANQVIVKILFGSQIFLCISSLLIGWHRNQGLHLLIQQVLVADESLRKIGIEPNYREVAKSQILKTTLFILIICIAIAVINVTMLYEESVTFGRIMFLVVFDFPAILISLGDSTFLNIIQYSTLKLKKLNNVLKTKLTSTYDCPQHANLLRYYRIRANAQRSSNDISSDDLYTITMARLGHLNFTQFCETLNKVFSHHILISMFVAMIMLTGSLYHTYAILKAENIIIKHNYVFAIAGSLFVYNMFRIYLFAKYCSELTDESIKTGDIIAELFDENISEECQTEIRHFEKQLIERPLRIHMTFATVDYTFVQKAIATVATNLIILTQVGDVSIEVPEK